MQEAADPRTESLDISGIDGYLDGDWHKPFSCDP